MFPDAFSHLSTVPLPPLAGITTPRLGLHSADPVEQRRSQRIIVAARTEQRMLPRLAPSGTVKGLHEVKILGVLPTAPTPERRWLRSPE
jgi:hypothetical protein